MWAGNDSANMIAFHETTQVHLGEDLAHTIN